MLTEKANVYINCLAKISPRVNHGRREGFSIVPPVTVT